MNEITIAVTGQLVDAPKLSYTADAKPVINFTVANNSSYRDGQGNWHEREPVFMPCSIWGDQAERVATLNKGDRVLVTGRLESRSFKPAESDRPITRHELVATEVAVSLRYATAQVTRIKKEAATV
jgi:single-strand DNA-binding protein